MPELSRKQARNLVDRYFHAEGWYPRGTAAGDWEDVTIAELGLDDPPLDSDPHVQKKRVALDLQKLFWMLGSGLASPLAELKKKTSTVGELADWCHENQVAS